jgi:hypothetical protein
MSDDVENGLRTERSMSTKQPFVEVYDLSTDSFRQLQDGRDVIHIPNPDTKTFRPLVAISDAVDMPRQYVKLAVERVKLQKQEAQTIAHLTDENAKLKKQIELAERKIQESESRRDDVANFEQMLQFSNSKIGILSKENEEL